MLTILELLSCFIPPNAESVFRRDVHYLSFWWSTAAVPVSLHGIPRLFQRHSTGNCEHTTGYRGYSTGFHGHSTRFHGIPQVTERRGGPWHEPWQFPRQSPRQVPTTYHGRPWHNGKTHGNAYGMEVVMEYAVVLPWVAMVGTTEVATDRTAARAIATTVALAVEALCTMESRGPCRGNSRVSTVARGSLKTHGRPRKCHGH